MDDIISLCGFKCNICPAYKSNIKTESDRARVDEGWKKFHCSPGWIYEEEYCEGCSNGFRYSEKPPLRDYCAIRRCALLNKVENCGRCFDYPCPRIKRFIHGVNLIAERTRRIGTKEEYDTFVQPHLNKDRLDKINEEFKKEFKERPAIKEVYSLDEIAIKINPKILDKFQCKEKIGVEYKERIDIDDVKEGILELYTLLRKVMTLKCHTPGGREQELKEREDDMLFLFITGVIGKIEKDIAINQPYLEVEVDKLNVFGYKKYQVSRKVREMSEFDLTGIFEEKLKIYFMKNPNVVISLKFYVDVLLDEYSKKEAFSKFKKADMSVFAEVQ